MEKYLSRVIVRHADEHLRTYPAVLFQAFLNKTKVQEMIQYIHNFSFVCSCFVLLLENLACHSVWPISSWSSDVNEIQERKHFFFLCSFLFVDEAFPDGACEQQNQIYMHFGYTHCYFCLDFVVVVLSSTNKGLFLITYSHQSEGSNREFWILTNLRIILFLIGFPWAVRQQITVFSCLQSFAVKTSSGSFLLICFLGKKTPIVHIGFIKNILV